MGDGPQIKLDAEHSQIPEIAKLAQNGQGKALYVVIYSADDFQAPRSG